MKKLDLANSQLLKVLRQAVDRPPRPSQEGPRVLFLPWFTLGEGESKEKLTELARHLEIRLLVVSAHYSVTQDAHALRELARACCGESTALTLEDALRQLPYSAALEGEIVERISAEVHRQGQETRLAIAALRAGPDADAAVSRMLDRAAQIGVKTVLVFAHKRPPGQVESVELPLRLFRKDIYSILPEVSRAPGKSKRAAPKGFYEKLLAFFKKKIEEPEKLATSSTRLSRLDIRESDGRMALPDPLDEPVADWADLLTRLSQSNWGIAASIAQKWQKLGGLIVAHFKDLESKKHLSPDNAEEREAFELRLRFITMLKALYPPVFDAAALELDGADQLYRVLLILCGQSHSDSLVAGHLMPFWQQQLDDPLFQELCYACFNEIGRDRSLVPRIESRAQLYRLLALLHKDEPGACAGDSADALKELVIAHVDWIRDLSVSPQPDRDAMRSIRQMAEGLVDANPTATEAMQAAQALMSVFELLPDDPVGLKKFTDDRRDLFGLIERLTRRAINQSRGAIRFDAALLRARANAVKGDADEGLDILRIMRRTVRDPMGRCAVDIEEAFIHERVGDLLKANHLYEDSLLAAERMGADELVARAANGCLRCDAVGFNEDEQISVKVRARIIVEIQSARAPELFPMSKRSKPTLFISYRSESSSITNAIAEEFKKDESRLAAWTDQDLAYQEKFNPKIHQRLHDSDAIVLLLSPKYFDSPWCVHELHFALGQNQLRGVPLYWAWCAPKPGEGEPCELLARKSFTQFVKDNYGSGEASGQLDPERTARLGHQQAHITDRLNLLFARGRLLARHPIVYSTDPASAVRPLIDALNRSVDFLYRRARLSNRELDAATPAEEPEHSAPDHLTADLPAQAKITPGNDPQGASPCPQ